MIVCDRSTRVAAGAAPGGMIGHFARHLLGPAADQVGKKPKEMHGDPTRNQHFVSRVEQKLNALNPHSTSKKFRIYSFTVANRETCEIALENPRGRPIATNLSMLDLFSFDVSDHGPSRKNLEKLFHKYEANVEFYTNNLMAKLAAGDSDIKAEMIDLFAAKLLNFIRNPFCIQKVLNSFPGITSYEPTDPTQLATYREILSGRKPHQKHLCGDLGISDQLYGEWLRLLFMLLEPTADDRPNLFESVIKRLMESRGTQAAAFVSMYDDDRCLLSDRSFCEPVAQGPHIMGMSFNLCSTAFIDYVFADPAKIVEGRASPEFVAAAVADWQRRPNVTINVTMVRNNRDMLVRYNRRAVEQCYERVYCSAKTGIVLA
jgi:hypothetical protein